MRLRVGAVLCLFLAFWGVGCRKALAPTLDNQPPETWIVAAPQDTITVRDSNGRPIRPGINKIPVRFHMYWAGSDRDGAVVGFYWAVVETLPLPPEGQSNVPSLPGPKARDYHYTTATDSIFIFSASEQLSERQHAFYIYAVDDKGRPDPTPARFIFSAYDRFPPEAVIDECKAVGFEYVFVSPGVVAPVEKTYFVTDFHEAASNAHPFPRDTVSSNARLHMRWHGVPTIPSTVVTGYRYKLDETAFNTADSSVHEVNYNTGVGLDKVSSGQKIFTLRAIGQSGWRGESTRWFQMNFAPDSWFAGPDPSDPAAGWQTATGRFPGKYLPFPTEASWRRGVPNSMLSQDSFFVFPALRPERRTFLEIYSDRLWLRQEGDTVHLNSWVIFPAGGFDRDSPYNVHVNTLLDTVAVHHYPVLTPGLPNGSPVAFHVRVQVKDAAGQITNPSESAPYPVFDPLANGELPWINGYQGLTSAGRAYAVVRSEDGDHTVDQRIEQRLQDAVGVVTRVESNTGSPQDLALRAKIITFYVNHPPVLETANSQFRPTRNQVLNSRFLTQGPNLNLIGSDDDPLDPLAIGNKVGGPGQNPITLRAKVAIIGKYTADPTRDTCFIAPDINVQNPLQQIVIPPWIANGNITMVVRLCDCLQCDAQPAAATCPAFVGREPFAGQGTCVDTAIPCRLNAP